MAIEAALIGAAAGVVSAAISFAGFWLALGGRLGKVEAKAEDALQTGAEAAEAAEAAKEANASVVALAANFSLYRETAAKEFVNVGVMHEVERRIIASNDKLEGRLS